MKQGPNVRKLIARKMSMIMVPDGGGFLDAVDSMVRPGGIEAAALEATGWVMGAIAAVKSAPDNPFGDDDEAIAAEVIKRAGL